MVPGEILFADDDIELNAGLETVKLRVTNTGDRPVQIGAHYHFFEVNPAVKFDRERAYGHRLDIPAGTTIRLEPGQSQTVRLVPYRGERIVNGFRGYVDGPLDDAKVREAALKRANDAYNPGPDDDSKEKQEVER